MIANTTIAHLSACKYLFRDKALQIEREKIRLSMGALKTLGDFWPLGKRTYREIGIIAREILALADQDINPVPMLTREKTPQLPTNIPDEPMFDVDKAFDISDLFDKSNSIDFGFASMPMLTPNI